MPLGPLLLFEGEAAAAVAPGGAGYQQYYRALLASRPVLIELNEATAARRRVPCRLFLSNGTAPDTGGLDEAVIMGVNSLTTISLDSTLRAVHAAQGMYAIELTQSEISILGTHLLYHTVGDFPQHFATVQVVNSNPFSTQSNDLSLRPTVAGRTLDVSATGEAGIDWANIGAPTTAVDLSGTSILGVVRLDSSVTPRNALYSAVTVRIDPVDYSGATVGINNAVGDVSSRFTAAIGALSYSAVTVRVTGIVASSFQAGAIDAAALATDAGQEIADRVLLRNIDTGNDSGRSVAQAFAILRNRVDASSSVMTVYQTDDVTSAWTASITTGAAASIQQVDPL